MDYLTRQLLLELIKLREAYEKHSSAKDAIKENNRKQQQIERKALENVLSQYDELVRNKSIGEGRQYKVQNSIRKATWIAALAAVAAFIAASVYACITYKQWQTAKLTLVAQTRPWIEIEDTPKITVGKLTESDANLRFDVTVKNHGHSPAILARPRFIWVPESTEHPVLFDRYNPCKDTVEDLDEKNIRRFAIIAYPDREPKLPTSTSLAVGYDLMSLWGSTISHVVGCVAYRGAGGLPFHGT